MDLLFYGACIGMVIGALMMILPEYLATKIKANARPPTRNDNE